jgi:hypothetical protein
MCDPCPEKDPDAKLAKLFKNETGIDVPSSVMRMFIRANWKRVTVLAHAIHGSDCPTETPRDIYGRRAPGY